MNALSKSAMKCSPQTSHSQISMTRHPIASNAVRFARSRRTLPRSFFAQKSCRVFGNEARGQSLCMCQKQPWTNTTVRQRGRTMSGVPGSPRSCRRNLRPAACKADRTSTSGAVFLPRTRLISRLLRSDTGGSTDVADFAAECFFLTDMRSNSIAPPQGCNRWPSSGRPSLALRRLMAWIEDDCKRADRNEVAIGFALPQQFRGFRPNALAHRGQRIVRRA